MKSSVGRENCLSCGCREIPSSCYSITNFPSRNSSLKETNGKHSLWTTPLNLLQHCFFMKLGIKKALCGHENVRFDMSCYHSILSILFPKRTTNNPKATTALFCNFFSLFPFTVALKTKPTGVYTSGMWNVFILSFLSKLLLTYVANFHRQSCSEISCTKNSRSLSLELLLIASFKSHSLEYWKIKIRSYWSKGDIT